jgi:hypothetical protein
MHAQRIEQATCFQLISVPDNPGPYTVLTHEEEGALAGYLVYMAEYGFLLTANVAKGLALTVMFW